METERFETVIQAEPYGRREQVVMYLTPKMRERFKRNHDQTPERLRERGGLDWLETLWIMRDEPWGGSEPNEPSDEEARRLCLESGKVELL